MRESMTGKKKVGSNWFSTSARWNAVVTTSGNIQGLDNSIVAPSLAHKTEGTFNHSDPKVGARELQASFEDHATALTRLPSA